MSIEAVHWALRTRIKGTAKLVLIGIANHASAEFDEARPSVPTLARYACCEERSVRRLLRNLEADGWISHYGWHSLNGRPDQKVKIYRLNTGGQNVTPSQARGDRGATPQAERGDTGGPNGVTPRSPEPSFKKVGDESPTPPLGKSEKSAGTSEGQPQALPTGFPDELKPHLRAVHKVLSDLAGRQKNAKAVNVVSLASTIMARPRKPLVRSAHDCAAHWDARGTRLRDVTAAYRNWLDRTEDLAAIEQLAGSGQIRELPSRERYSRYDRAAGL